MVAIAGVIKFLNKTLTVFLARQNPASSIANPALIPSTKIEQINTQRLSIVIDKFFISKDGVDAAARSQKVVIINSIKIALIIQE